MSLAVLSPKPLGSRWRTPYDRLAGGVVLNRRAGQSGRKAPGGHMKTRLQPLFPRRPGIGGLREEPVGRVEKPGAGLQLLVALRAAVLARRNRIRPGPRRRQFPVQALGALGDQGGDRRPQPMPIQPAQCPCAHCAQPAMQGGRMGSVLTQPRHRLPQAGRRAVYVRIRRAGRFHHRPRVALVGGDLSRQDAEALPAYGAAALRHRRLAVLDAATARPARSPRHPPAGIDQRAHRTAGRTRNQPANRFAFDGRGFQRIIRDGDGSWDSTLSGSPRGTGVRAPVPHFLQKVATLSLQRLSRKQLVYNRALMSMSFLSSLQSILSP
jgi:hypothetical protein